MPWRCIFLAMAAISSMLGGTARATAQTPASYNYDRAYRHFLGSRYSYRTLYSSLPGAGSVAVTLFVYQSQFIDPAFSKQWITPYFYERFDAFPGLGGMTLTPFSFSSYYAPGFGHGLYAPYGGPIVEYYYR
jgi:hypothetical protein